MQKVSAGQSYIEYMIIGGLVSVAIFAGCLTFAGDLNGILKGVFSGMTSKSGAALAHAPKVPSPAVPLPPVGDPTLTDMDIKLRDGSVLSLKDVPVNLPKLVETVGANGTTDKIAFALEDLARKLRDAGEITEEQANYLLRLANQGHRMASVQKQIEDMIQKGADQNMSPFHVMENFDGRPSNILNIASVFGSNYDSLPSGGLTSDMIPSNIEDVPDADMYNGNELKTLKELYDAAKLSGALNDPVINEIVNKMTSDISNIGQLVSLNVSKLASTYTMGEVFNKDELNNRVGADNHITNNKSATICTAGGDSDSGVHCSRGG